MNQPGITVEPLYAFNGKRLWNQVFFDEVRVPRNQILGEENRGWTVAKNLLGNERLLVSRVAENRRILSIIKEAMAEDKAIFSRDLSERMIRLEALEATAVRLLTRFDDGFEIGAEPSILKLKGSQLVQDMDRLLFEFAGYYGLPLDSTMHEGGPVFTSSTDMVASGLFHHRGYTIAGGTSEIQHNIIAQHVLGL